MSKQDNVKQWLQQVQMDALAQSARRHYEKAVAEQPPRKGLFRRRRAPVSLAEPRVFSNHVAVEVLDGCARLTLDNHFPRLAFSLKGGDDSLVDLKPALFLRADKKNLGDMAKSLQGWRRNSQGEFYRYLDASGKLIALGFPGKDELRRYTVELRAARSNRSLPDGLRLQVRPQTPHFVHQAMSLPAPKPTPPKPKTPKRKNLEPQKKN